MKLVWLTDIHLNFLDESRRSTFYDSITNDCDALVISGDIAEATSIVKILEEMAAHVKKPIYFVLGNHDYYRGQIYVVRDSIRMVTNNHPHLFWLEACEPILLDKDILLVGADGWADGRYGDYSNSYVNLNDSRLIAELYQQRILGRFQLLEKMQQLADEDAKNLYAKLILAASHNPSKLIVITHVPPFRETAMHEGKISDDDFLPFFTSKATGDVLLKFAKEQPSMEVLVLCGHSHDECKYQPLDNLTVYVGKAEYNQPSVQGLIDTQKYEIRWSAEKISQATNIEAMEAFDKIFVKHKKTMDALK